MKKSKILFILSVPPPFGGGEIVSDILANGLSKDYFIYKFSKKYYNKNRQANFNFLGIYYSFKFIILVFCQLIYLRPDSIYIGLPKGFLSFFRNSIIIILCNKFGVKVYSEIHGMSFPFIEKSKNKKVFFDYILSMISSIRVLSHSIKDYLIKNNYNGKIHIISNGIPKPNFSRNYKSSPKKLNMLYFGAISSKKGFFRVLDILIYIKKKFKNRFSLNVVGEWVNKYEESMAMTIIDKHDLHEYINFHGLKKSEEKWSTISSNDIMIHLTDFDGQPLTIIESMSFGIPTISTKVGAIPEMITNNVDGFLVDNNSEVIKLINDILQNKLDIDLICKNAINKYSKNYTEKIMISGIIQMIENNETANTTT